MGTSEWVKDLQALAAARKKSGQSWIKEAQQLREAVAAQGAEKSRVNARLSFLDDCQMFAYLAEHGVHPQVARMSDLGIVQRLADNIAEIMMRLEAVGVPERTKILAEYGLQDSVAIDRPRLTSMRLAAEEIGTNLSAAVWYCSGRDERERYSENAEVALNEFLGACR